jgi:hypothetical protein
MRRVRPFLSLFAAIVATLAVVACSESPGDGGSGDRGADDRHMDHDTLSRALAATRTVETGRVQVTTVLTGLTDVPDPPPGGRVTLAVHRAAFDRHARRVEVETDLSSAAALLGPPEGASVGDLSVPARMVAVGDVLYAQGGPMAAVLGRPPTGWVEIDRAAFVAQEPGSDTALLVLDPLGPFDVVGDAAGEVRVVGEEELQGAPVTHVASRVGADAGARGAPLDVWIDRDGVIRRLELRLGPGPGAGRAAGAFGVGELVTKVELLDVGGPVDIAVPEASRGRGKGEP